MASFVSDNVAGAHPKVGEALLAANAGDALPYGDDAWSERLDRTFSALFGTEVVVIPCATGTAANALALSLVAGPVNAICAHSASHIFRDECNAPEFYTGGARLTPIAGGNGKLDLAGIVSAIGCKGDRHAAQALAVTLAQATESGTVYTASEVGEVGALARAAWLQASLGWRPIRKRRGQP